MVTDASHPIGSPSVAGVAHSFDSISLDELRRRRSQKWRRFEPDVLPVWVAEMDFPLAEPIREVLETMTARGDTGYTTRTALPEIYAAFAARHHEQEVDPSRISVVLDVMRGVYLALQLFTGPGEPEVPQPPTDLGQTTDAWIAHALASAPPLSKETARRVSAALFGAAP